ncbi:hypothetical protein D3C83_85640 [compost metagenome]
MLGQVSPLRIGQGAEWRRNRALVGEQLVEAAEPRVAPDVVTDTLERPPRDDHADVVQHQLAQRGVLLRGH